MELDLGSFDSVKKFAKDLKAVSKKPLDRLVCNAAVYQPALQTVRVVKRVLISLSATIQRTNLAVKFYCNGNVCVIRHIVELIWDSSDDFNRTRLREQIGCISSAKCRQSAFIQMRL